jgi:uncharacterized membrane protein
MIILMSEIVACWLTFIGFILVMAGLSILWFILPKKDKFNDITKEDF